MKNLQADVLEKTLPFMVKKAKAEGDYSEINQIRSIIQSGASSAGDLIGIGSTLKNLFKGMGKK